MSMVPRKSVSTNMFVATPRLARSKVDTASTRKHGSQRKDLQDTSSFLEVVSLSNQEGHQGHRPIKMENTYKMEPDKTFRSREVEKATEAILAEYLEDKKYDSHQCRILSQTVSAKILESLKELGFVRYKMVAVVSIGSMKERPGMQFGSRCLWNKDTDNFISAKYSNTSLFAVAMVYGLYYD